MIIARHESYHWSTVAYIRDFLYDAEFDVRDIVFDAPEGELTLPITQRLYGLKKSKKWSFFSARTAARRCILTFRSVTKYEISGDAFARPTHHSIGGLEYSRAARVFQLLTHEGTVVCIETESPTVSLELTDEEIA